MRRVDHPEDAILDTSSGPRPYKFRTFAREFIWPYPRWVSDAAWEEARDAVAVAFDRGNPGDVHRLAEDHWEKLCEAIRALVPGAPIGCNIEVQGLASKVLRAKVVKEPRAKGDTSEPEAINDEPAP